MNKVLTCLIILLVCTHKPQAKPAPDSIGFISGKILVDADWERMVYMSRIETFEQKYTVSDAIIIASADLDSLGNFRLSLDQLNSGWNLVRIHIVKRGAPPASLIIGSEEENFYFIVTQRNSIIQLHNSAGRPVFNKVFLSGAPYMSTFEYITKLSAYPEKMGFVNSPVEKEFVELVISEKLKIIADTAKNPLVSLYALYQTDFRKDLITDPGFYKRYHRKWKNERSSYFESFRQQVPLPGKKPWLISSIILFVLSGFLLLMYIRYRKSNRISKLSAQERRIFELLQKGANNKEISDQCHIELSTVKSHVSNIYLKLKIKSRKEAMNFNVR